MRSLIRLAPAAAVAFALAAPAAAQAGSYSDAVLLDSPTAYYRLDEPTGVVAADAVGHADGTYNGGFTLGAPPPFGDAGKAVTLDNTGTVTATPGSVSSVEFWVNASTVKEQTFISIGDVNTGGWSVGIGQNHGSQKRKLIFKTSAGTTNSKISLAAGRFPARACTSPSANRSATNVC